MEPAPVLLFWSGGKDCLLALAQLRAQPAFAVVALLATITRSTERVVGHGVPREILAAQARALGLPLISVLLEPDATNAEWLAAHAAALAQAQRSQPGLRHLAFGDIFLADARAWREEQFARISWQALFPLWGRDTRQLARECIDAGHRASLVCVDTMRLDGAFCGRAFDRALLAELPPGIDPCGENGEFHTLVHDSPMFAAPLSLARGGTRLEADRFRQLEVRLTTHRA